MHIISYNGQYRTLSFGIIYILTEMDLCSVPTAACCSKIMLHIVTLITQKFTITLLSEI